MEEDVSHSPLATHEDTTTTADIPPQLPSSLVADTVTDGPPTCSLGTEHIEDRPLDSTRSPYDIV